MQQKVAKVKRLFFAYRNGIVADVMRRGGSPYRIIFGLTVPQVTEIAPTFGQDIELARELWIDTDVRESAMLAPMLANPSTFTIDEAIEWTSSIKSTEIADIFALKLLRKTSFLNEIVEILCDSSRSDMQRYTGLRAAFGLLNVNSKRIIDIAHNELSLGCQLTVPVARQLLDMALNQSKQ